MVSTKGYIQAGMRHEDEIRALLLRRDRRHRRAYPEFLGFTARCGHNAALERASNGDRLATQFGIIALLD